MVSNAASADGIENAIRSTAGLISQTGREVSLTLARATYTTTYFVSYAVVFSAVFVARALPRDNPVMKGLADGGRAARDAVDGS